MALTFDAEHPDRTCDPGMEERLLDLLTRLEVRATFFVQGRWVEAHPSTAQRMAADHLVGNHSHYHCPMPLLSDEGLVADIESAERAFVENLGIHPRPWFRCPFGAGAGDSRVLGVLGRLGYVHVGWDVSAEDWVPGRTAAGIADAIVGGLTPGNGSIVLMHAWPSMTVDAVTAIVTRLRAMDTAFVGVDELPFPPVSTVPW